MSFVVDELLIVQRLRRLAFDDGRVIRCWCWWRWRSWRNGGSRLGLLIVRERRAVSRGVSLRRLRNRGKRTDGRGVLLGPDRDCRLKFGVKTVGKLLTSDLRVAAFLNRSVSTRKRGEKDVHCCSNCITPACSNSLSGLSPCALKNSAKTSFATLGGEGSTSPLLPNGR